MDNSLEFILNHPVLSVALFIFIYLIISFEIKNFTKKYKVINCNDLVTKINDNKITLLDTREKSEFKKGHISNAILFD
ncbi:MAG: rhodanese-like domain-containing protein, partial [Gammaproteobacteria bacterium]